MAKKSFHTEMALMLRVSSLRLVLLLLAICYGAYLYLHGLDITGPFIFGDELAYFSFARSIFHNESLRLHTQYGPLFPALASFFFSAKSIVQTYQVIRIFNIIVYISSIIPAYLFAQEIFNNRWLRVLLPICALITPFSGVVYLIWAEPLYVTLFYWTCFLLCLHAKKPGVAKSLLLGTLLSLLYYAKPASGLVAQIAAGLTLVFCYVITRSSQTKRTAFLNITVMLTCLVLTLPWMLHYHYLGMSIVGYPVAVDGLVWRIVHEGYQTIAFNIVRGLFYQFSYFFIGSWGLIGVGIAFFITQRKKLNITEIMVWLFLMLCVFGLIALSALGMSSVIGTDFKMPQGRYFSLLFPLLITLTLHFIFKNEFEQNRDIKWALIAILLTTCIAIIASPFYSRSPLAFNSMPEMAPFIYIFDKGLVVWRAPISTPGILLRLVVPLSFGLFAASILLLRKMRYTCLIASLVIFMWMLFSSYTEIYYINIIGATQSGLNSAFIFLNKNQIAFSQVALDKKMEPGNVQFLTPFWMGKTSVYLKLTDVRSGRVGKATYFLSQEELPRNKIFSANGYSIYRIDKEK